ncbi:hypothetical protein KCU98_g10, partial [Aureobasidium melanogenum]
MLLLLAKAEERALSSESELQLLSCTRACAISCLACHPVPMVNHVVCQQLCDIPLDLARGKIRWLFSFIVVYDLLLNESMFVMKHVRKHIFGHTGPSKLDIASKFYSAS